MAINVPDEGAAAFLEASLNDVWPVGGPDLTSKLFCNDIAMTDADTSATFTEAVGGGYAAKTLTAGSWVVSNVGGIDQAAYAKQVFSFTGALTTNETVYGYYVVDDDDTVKFAELFDAGVTPVEDGNHIDITPIFQASKGTPA